MKKVFLFIFILLLVCSTVFADMVGNTIMPRIIIISYLILFAINYTVETSILFLLLRKRFKTRKILLASLMANTITHPIAVFFMPFVLPLFWPYFIITEILVFLTETWIIYWFFNKKIELKKAAAVAFTANFVTAMLSFVPFFI